MSDERSRYVAGRNPVRELLEQDADRVEKVLYLSSGGGSLGEIRRMADAAGIPVQAVPQGKLNSLVPGVNHQGIVAVVSPIRYMDVDEMLSSVAATLDEVQERKPIILILDHIQDPHNLGAIIRSAVAAGAGGVVIPERGAAPVTAAAVKTSAGTVSQIPIARVGNIKMVIQAMKERGYWIAGAEGTGSTTHWDMDWDRAIGLVIGSEEKGMSRTVRELCDYEVRIPMRGMAESLNASVAAAVLLFEATRCRVG